MTVFAARLMRTLFCRQIALSIHKKDGQGEFPRRLNRLFLGLNIAINRRVMGTLSPFDWYRRENVYFLINLKV